MIKITGKLFFFHFLDFKSDDNYQIHDNRLFNV